MARLDNLDKKRKSRQNRYFSESFRKQRVREYEQNLLSVAEISREYEVSSAAVYKWIYKYSRYLKQQTKQVVELKSDTRKIQTLKARIKELERIIGQKQIMIEFQEKMIEIAEQEYAIDIKKKFGSSRSSTTGNTDTNMGTR